MHLKQKSVIFVPQSEQLAGTPESFRSKGKKAVTSLNRENVFEKRINEDKSKILMRIR